MAAISPIPPTDDQPRLLTPMGVAKIVVVLIMVLVSGWLLWTHTEWFENPSLVKVEVLSWGIWGPVVYILLYAVGPFLVPGAVMTIAGGLAFGALWGAVYSLVGADAGALIAFSAGRFLGRSFVQRIVGGGRFEKILGHIGRHGFQIIFYLRLVPLIPYNALNLLAGASPITFRDYFWASAIGMIPGTILFAFLGDALWHPTSPRFFVALALIAVCFTGGELARRRGWLPNGS